jgi:hypothetical protein
MPYFKKNDVNVLVIHIPKTGGSSVEHFFSKKYDIRLNSKSLYYLKTNQEQLEKTIPTKPSLQHFTYELLYNYKKILDIDFENNIKIITVVRNPYERTVSDLFWYSKITANSSKNEVFDAIRDFTSNPYEWYDNHNRPQYTFITKDNEIIPNIHILRTETLIDDMHNLGYPDFNMHINKNRNSIKNADYFKFLNRDSIKLINDVYDNDFKLFNYTKISEVDDIE